LSFETDSFSQAKRMLKTALKLKVQVSFGASMVQPWRTPQTLPAPGSYYWPLDTTQSPLHLFPINLAPLALVFPGIKAAVDGSPVRARI
jgi:hypothetical protein